jgi:integrase
MRAQSKNKASRTTPDPGAWTKRLTAVSVDKVKADPNKRREISDGGSGLYLVVQPNGGKSWAVRYRHAGRPSKLTLGGYPALSLATARARAAKAIEQVGQGHNPAADKRAERQKALAEAAAASSLEEAFSEFLDKHQRTRQGRPIRESTRRETARLLGLKRDSTSNAWVASGGGVLARWHGKVKMLQAVTKRDVIALLDDLMKSAPVSANRTLSALKTCFRWHVKRDNLLASPAADIDDPAPEGKGRERVLTDGEIAALWRACDAELQYASMVRLLVLTGCRRDEVRKARRSEFDLEKREWLVPGERVKNGVAHLIPITDAMATILEKLPRIVNRQSNDPLLFTTNGRTPISGLSKIKKRVEAAMTKELGHPPKQWGLHDLRRTFISGLQAKGIVREVREQCVNHRTAQSGVAGIYEKYEFWGEKRHAFDLWSKHIAQVVSGKPAKTQRARGRVVPLQEGGGDG